MTMMPPQHQIIMTTAPLIMINTSLCTKAVKEQEKLVHRMRSHTCSRSSWAWQHSSSAKCCEWEQTVQTLQRGSQQITVTQSRTGRLDDHKDYSDESIIKGLVSNHILHIAAIDLSSCSSGEDDGFRSQETHINCNPVMQL